MLYEFGSGYKEELRSEFGSGGNGSIEFRNSGLEESYQLGVPFFCFFPSLLFSFQYLITSLDLRPVQMASARVLPPPDLSQREVEFPRAPDLPKGHPERY
jgi:hypothetical protein